MPKIEKQTREYYDWEDLRKAVEEKSGRDIEDWFGAHKNQPTAKDFKIGNFPAAKWAIEKGYDWRVLNDPVDSAGMTERCRINTEYRNRPDKADEIPYCGFWGYADDCIFFEVHNGSIHYFNPYESLAAVEDLDPDGNSQEWVREILRCFMEVFKENNMPNEIEVHISW